MKVRYKGENKRITKWYSQCYNSPMDIRTGDVFEAKWFENHIELKLNGEYWVADFGSENILDLFEEC